MKSPFSSDFTLGILGGGQLGKMLLQETSRMDIRTAVLDPSADAPCAHRAELFVQGNLQDKETVLAFGRRCNVVTIEIEHVNVEALEILEREGITVAPSSKLLKVIQNKRLQKEFYRDQRIPTAPFFSFANLAALREMPLSYPCVYKSALHGYDGRGVSILRQASDLNLLNEGPGIIEAFVENAKEISVMVSRNAQGKTAVYDPVEMEFHPTANLVEFLFSPSTLSEREVDEAKRIALKVADSFGLVGLLAVEMFVRPDGMILVNESAPRPHNSGHHTIESNYTSQYEQHLRAVLGLPPGSVRTKSAAVMINILGEPGHSGPVEYRGISEVMGQEGVYVHIYGKKETRPFRKMGHVTIIAEDLEIARKRAIFVRDHLKAETCKNL